MGLLSTTDEQLVRDLYADHASVLLGYVRRHDYSPFVLYRLAAALAIAIVIVSGVRDATF